MKQHSKIQYTHKHTHAHTTILRPLFRDYLGEPVPEEIFFWTFVMVGKMTDADTPIIRLGTTPSGLTSDPPPSSPPSMYINYNHYYIH